MTARNDITGQFIRSRPNSKTYKDNWDKIFGSKKEEVDEEHEEVDETPELNPVFSDEYEESLFFQAIGWTHAQCCVWLDEGKDPRTEECSQLIDMAIRDFLNANFREE